MALVRASRVYSTTDTTSYTLASVQVDAGQSVIVCVGLHTPGDRTVSSVVRNSQNFTKHFDTGAASGHNEVRGEIWYYNAPSTGTYDIVVTLSGSLGSGNAGVSAFVVDSFSGLRTGNYGYAAGLNASVSVSATSVSGDVVCDAFVCTYTGGENPAAGGGQTVATGGGAGDKSKGSSKTASGTSTSMSWSVSVSLGNPLVVAAAVIPAAISPADNNAFRGLGRGLHRGATG